MRSTEKRADDSEMRNEAEPPSAPTEGTVVAKSEQAESFGTDNKIQIGPLDT